jgi:hypothetical protein
MSNGVCVLAQNNSTTNYVEQTYALALSILANSPNTNITIITNDIIPTTYKNVFDQVISIPEKDAAADVEWKIDNRWKIHNLTPYENTLVFDADMLALDNIEFAWQDKSALTFTTTVNTYRNEVITNRYYRNTFDENALPNIYTGMYRFKKDESTSIFFILLELVMQNWEIFYKKYTPNKMQNWNSVDVSAAIVLKILDIEYSKLLSFTHMKPQIQNWQHIPSKWTDALAVDFGNDKIYINGYKQSGVLHYVEDEFLTADMLKWLEGRV